jgi:hypothetical protein
VDIMYNTDIELTNTQAQGIRSAALLPGEDADLRTHTSLPPAAELVAVSDAERPRSLVVESLARHMDEEAQRCRQRIRSLDAFLHSGKVRRRTAWQRSRRSR